MPEDRPLELNRAVPGGRVEMFAIRDDDYPGGWFYRFQYYHPEDGERLRYDKRTRTTNSGGTTATAGSATTPKSSFTGSSRTSYGSWTRSPNSPTPRIQPMTDTDHDGWPDKYRDPRDRPHPDVLRVTVETFDDVREGTIDAVNTVAEGESPPAVVSFATVGELRKILTDRRIELLRTLMDTDGAAESISALAEDLDRDYRTVHDDVTLLEGYGLLFVVDEGQAKRPYLPYKRIHLDVELTGRKPGEESAPA